MKTFWLKGPPTVHEFLQTGYVNGNNLESSKRCTWCMCRHLPFCRQHTPVFPIAPLPSLLPFLSFNPPMYVWVISRCKTRQPKLNMCVHVFLPSCLFLLSEILISSEECLGSRVKRSGVCLPRVGGREEGK